MIIRKYPRYEIASLRDARLRLVCSPDCENRRFSCQGLATLTLLHLGIARTSSALLSTSATLLKLSRGFFGTKRTVIKYYSRQEDMPRGGSKILSLVATSNYYSKMTLLCNENSWQCFLKHELPLIIMNLWSLHGNSC